MTNYCITIKFNTKSKSVCSGELCQETMKKSHPVEDTLKVWISIFLLLVQFIIKISSAVTVLFWTVKVGEVAPFEILFEVVKVYFPLLLLLAGKVVPLASSWATLEPDVVLIPLVAPPIV